MELPQSLRRLHSLREAEEHQKRSLLELAIAEQHRLETALQLSRDRAKRGRALVTSSAQSGESEDRISGLEEIAAADRQAKVLLPRLRAAEECIERARHELLAKRVERRQAETLLESAEAQAAAESKRKSQIALDDWHRSRGNANRFANRSKRDSHVK